MCRSAFDHGKEVGRNETRRELARNFLNILDDETIASKTGLFLDEVVSLRMPSLPNG